MEQVVETKLAALHEALTQAERESGARMASLTAQIERRAPAPPAQAVPVAAAGPVSDPARTGSIGEKVKPESDKAAQLDAWALRDVYDGVAMLEDRKRRLIEVAPGDSIPGIGPIEAIERRGRGWVVVTKLGVITPKVW